MFGKLFRKLKPPTKPSLPGCLQQGDLDTFFAEMGKFWTGEAFACPEAQECAYELALVLVRVLAERTRNLAPFLATASWEDGGFAAAEALGFQMDEVVAGFLGEGEWGFKEPSL